MPAAVSVDPVIQPVDAKQSDHDEADRNGSERLGDADGTGNLGPVERSRILREGIVYCQGDGQVPRFIRPCLIGHSLIKPSRQEAGKWQDSGVDGEKFGIGSDLLSQWSGHARGAKAREHGSQRDCGFHFGATNKKCGERGNFSVEKEKARPFGIGLFRINRDGRIIAA